VSSEKTLVCDPGERVVMADLVERTKPFCFKKMTKARREK